MNLELTEEQKEKLVMAVLAGWPLCVREECGHIRRGYADADGIDWVPGVYCQCCIAESQGDRPESDDAYTCWGGAI